MSKWWLVPVALFIAGFIMLGLTFHADQHWAAVHSGTDIPAGQYSVYYNFWSGAGSDFGELTLVTAVVASAIGLYKQNECHSTTCHRPATMKTADGHKLCAKCAGKPHHELSLPFFHPHHSMTQVERDAAGITAENPEGDQSAGTG